MSTVRILNLSMQLWSSLTALVILICVIERRGMKRKSDRLYAQMLLLHISVMMLDVLALYFRGRLGLFNSIGVRASNFLQFVCGNFLAVTFFDFSKSYLENKLRHEIKTPLFKVTRVLLGALNVLMIVNLFYPVIFRIDERNLYSRLPAYAIYFILNLAILAVALILLMHYCSCLERWELIPFLIYILMPCAAMVLSMMYYGFAFSQVGTSFTLILIFIYLQSENSKREAEQEKDLVNMRVSIMMSQIQPHFLFNTLNSIEYLCTANPKEAADVVRHFAAYLRRGMDSITRQNLVSFQDEMMHLENYFYIEHIRFPHIEINYDLQVEDFQIPALTVQPLVENAIKHGLAEKKTQARIDVETYEDSENIYVSVTDNGCGFDVNVKPEDNRQHIGLENIQNRLKLMCQGELKITSAVGRGTSVEIKIPKFMCMESSSENR